MSKRKNSKRILEILLLFIFLITYSLFFVSCNNPNIKKEFKPTSDLRHISTDKWEMNVTPKDNISILVKFTVVDNEKLFAFTTKSILYLNKNKWDECYYNKDIRFGAGYTDGKIVLAAVTSVNWINQSISKDRLFYGELTQINNTYSLKNIKFFESPFSENTYGFHSIGNNKIFLLGLCECAVLYLNKKDTEGNFVYDFFPILKNPASDLLLMKDNNSNTPIVHSKDTVFQVNINNSKCELKFLFKLPEPEMIPGKISYPYNHINAAGNLNYGLLRRGNKLFIYDKIEGKYKVVGFDSLNIAGSSKSNCEKILSVSLLDKENIYCTLNDGRILHLVNGRSNIFNNLWEIISIADQFFVNCITVVNTTTIAIGNVSTAVLEKIASINKKRNAGKSEKSKLGFLNPVEYYSTSSFYGIGIGNFLNSQKEGLYVIDLYDLNKFNPIISKDFTDQYFDNQSVIYGLQGRVAGSGQTSNNYEFDVGVSVADINEDGVDDILISNLQGANSLLLNDGYGFFRDVTKTVCIDSSMYRSEGIITADVNNDGWLDIFSTSFLQSNRLFINHGGKFKDVTKESGLESNWGGISAQFADINNDSYPDLYVCNWIDENKMYLNLGNGKFRNITKESGTSCGTGKRSNSVVFADFNNDGLLDLFVGNRGTGNKLFKNIGKGRFIDISEEAGISQKLFTYGAAAVDLDNDGLLDLIVTDKTKLLFYKNYSNDKNKISFKDFSNAWLFNPDKLTANNVSLAAVDFEDDGDMDLIVTQSPGNIIRIHNRLNEDSTYNNFIKVKIYGSESNRNGIGVNLYLLRDGKLIGYREINGGNGYASCGSKVQHFGINNSKGNYELIVKFPVNKIVKHIPVSPGSQISLYEHEGLKEHWQLAKKSIYRLASSGWLLYEILKILIAFSLFIIVKIILSYVKNSNLLLGYLDYEKRQINILLIIYISTYLITRILISLYFKIYPDHESWINNSSNTFFNDYLPFITALVSLPISLPVLNNRNIKNILSTHYAGKLIIKLQEFYHGESSAMSINRLGLYFRNYKELNNADQEIVKRVKHVIEEFRTVTSREIIDVSNYGYNFIVINKLKATSDQIAQLRKQLIVNVNLLDKVLEQSTQIINTGKNQVTEYIAEKVIQLLNCIKNDINNFRIHIIQNLSCKLDDSLLFIKEKFGSDSKFLIDVVYNDIPSSISILLPKYEFEKVLIILLQNSFDAYMIDSLPLRVIITVSKKGKMIIIEIRDFGSGIKKENLNKLFSKGFTTKPNGSGFGLYYVKSVIEEFGGTITIESEYGKGTQVKLTFVSTS